MTLITLNYFGLMLLGVIIIAVVLILALYMINELRIVRANQRKLLATFGLDEEIEAEQVQEVAYRPPLR